MRHLQDFRSAHIYRHLLNRPLIFEQDVPQTGRSIEVERYRTGMGFELGIALKF